MSDDTFRTFEEEFSSLSSSLQRKLDSIAEQDDQASRSNLITEAEADIDDCNNRISNIEIEIRQYPMNLKRKVEARLKELKARFNEQVSELGRLKDSRPKSQNSSRNKDQRNRLLGVQEEMNQTDDSLDNTTRVIEETAHSGALTANQLYDQREALIRANENLKATDGILTNSRKLLIRMRRRIVTNKLISCLIILVEMAVIALIVYLKYYN